MQNIANVKNLELKSCMINDDDTMLIKCNISWERGSSDQDFYIYIGFDNELGRKNLYNFSLTMNEWLNNLNTYSIFITKYNRSLVVDNDGNRHHSSDINFLIGRYTLSEVRLSNTFLIASTSMENINKIDSKVSKFESFKNY